MNDFTFYSPTAFVFGRGTTDETGEHLAKRGLRRALVVYGQGSAVRAGTIARVTASLEQAGVACTELGGVRPNPEVGLVREGIEKARAFNADCVLAVGGGSAIDCAKAVAFGAYAECDVWDFFAKKLPIERALPVACVLTIPAAGSEGSNSCVISNDACDMKTGVNSDAFRPALAIMDPELTLALPAYQTAAGVTDMIAHICERYFSGAGPVPVTDNIACGLVRAIIDSARRVMRDPADYDARANLMWAGTLAHNDLAGCGRSMGAGRAGGWESHALEHELSAHYPSITHGAGLAVVMPAWMRSVWREDPQRFLSFGAEVFGIAPDGEGKGAEERTVLQTIDALQEFFSSIGMPRTLGEFGITPEEVDALLPTLAANKGEEFGCYKRLTMEDAKAIYLSAF